jgi:hypothetical protein
MNANQNPYGNGNAQDVTRMFQSINLKKTHLQNGKNFLLTGMKNPQYKRKEMNEKEIVKQLCQVLDRCEMKNNQIVNVVSTLLFSLGSSLEKCQPDNSQEVLIRYEKNKTFGNALMAQAIWMKETWAIQEEIPTEEKNKKGEENDG